MISKHFTITRLLSLFSAIAFIFAFYILYSSWLTLSWPSTIAKISHIATSTKGTTPGPKGPLMKITVNEASYSYVVNYEVFFGYTVVNSKNNIKHGSEIKIYYNPNNPQQSTTHAGINWAYFTSFISAGIILGFGAYAWHLKIKALTSHSSGTTKKRVAP